MHPGPPCARFNLLATFVTLINTCTLRKKKKKNTLPQLLSLATSQPLEGTAQTNPTKEVHKGNAQSTSQRAVRSGSCMMAERALARQLYILTQTFGWKSWPSPVALERPKPWRCRAPMQPALTPSFGARCLCWTVLERISNPAQHCLSLQGISIPSHKETCQDQATYKSTHLCWTTRFWWETWIKDNKGHC